MTGISPSKDGFWRPYVEQVIYRYLDCGNLNNGSATLNYRLQSVITYFNSILKNLGS